MTKETKCVRCANGDTRTADGFHLMSTGKYKRCADLPPYEQPATPSSKDVALLCCPFCGSDRAQVVRSFIDRDSNIAHCPQCDACGPRALSTEPAGTAEARWNAGRSAVETSAQHLHWCAVHIGKNCNCHSQVRPEDPAGERIHDTTCANCGAAWSVHLTNRLICPDAAIPDVYKFKDPNSPEKATAPHAPIGAGQTGVCPHGVWLERKCDQCSPLNGSELPK